MVLPKLRRDLDMMPSPDPQHPGLFIRDNYRYTDAWLIIPPLFVQGLALFDGIHTLEDLQTEFIRLSGQPDTTAPQELIDILDRSGFLDNATFIQMRDSRRQAFAQKPIRHALHAGSGYPLDLPELQQVLDGYLAGPPTHQSRIVGIAAPHVSPGGGRQSYGAAYRTLTPDLHDRTFVILGTSHFGQPNRFGLTRKPFETPLGTTRIDASLIDELASQPAVIMEDYCHAIEHSIEFQVIFLQHIYGPDITILPILCGSFGQSIYQNGMPEDDEVVRRFFGTLRDIAARDAERLFWVMGVDMAHVGVRYGDQFIAHADNDQLLQVRERDHDRISSLNAGDAAAFWDKIKENRDDLKWCGSSPLYTFMQVVPNARGSLQRYEQWNIDPQSVVSFAGISFAQP